MFPTTKSATANAKDDRPTISSASGRVKPPTVRVTRNSTRTASTSSPVTARFVTSSTTNDARYDVIDRTWPCSSAT